MRSKDKYRNPMTIRADADLMVGLDTKIESTLIISYKY